MSHYLIFGFGLTLLYCAGYLFLYSIRQQWEDYLNLTKDNVFCAHLGYFIFTFFGLTLMLVPPKIWWGVLGFLFLWMGCELLIYALRLIWQSYKNIMAGDVIIANLIGGGCLCTGIYFWWQIYNNFKI